MRLAGVLLACAILGALTFQAQGSTDPPCTICKGALSSNGYTQNSGRKDTLEYHICLPLLSTNEYAEGCYRRKAEKPTPGKPNQLYDVDHISIRMSVKRKDSVWFSSKTDQSYTIYFYLNGKPMSPFSAPNSQRIFVQGGGAETGPFWLSDSAHNPSDLNGTRYQFEVIPGKGAPTGKPPKWGKKPAKEQMMETPPVVDADG